MTWYLTIRSDADYSRSADAERLAAFLRSLPELVQTDVNTFANAPGQPWVSLVIAMSNRGSYANRGTPLPAVNLVDVACSYEHDESWYDALGAKIAEFLGWEAVDEHADRTVWHPQKRVR